MSAHDTIDSRGVNAHIDSQKPLPDVDMAGLPEPSDCNYVALPFVYDFRSDLQFKLLIGGGAQRDWPPMTDMAIAFAMAVVVQGGKKHVMAFKKFCPGWPTQISKLLWEDKGCKELHDYIDEIRLKQGTEAQTPKRPIVYLTDFLPEHDFSDDPCYSLLIKGVDDKLVEISKACAMGDNLNAAVRRVIPSLGNGKGGVEGTADTWGRNARALAICQYFKVLVALHSKPGVPRDMQDYNQTIEDMFWETTDVDTRLKLHRAITAFKGTGTGRGDSAAMPPDFDASDLEDDE